MSNSKYRVPMMGGAQAAPETPLSDAQAIGMLSQAALFLNELPELVHYTVVNAPSEILQVIAWTPPRRAEADKEPPRSVGHDHPLLKLKTLKLRIIGMLTRILSVTNPSLFAKAAKQKPLGASVLDQADKLAELAKRIQQQPLKPSGM